MKKTPLRRKTPLKRTGFKRDGLSDKPKKRINRTSARRSSEEATYRKDRICFLREHPVCPISGAPATEVHHAARRVGKWLNLKRYWIGVSREIHDWIEKNGHAAEELGLLIRINQTYDQHVNELLQRHIDLNTPYFYERYKSTH